MTVHGVGLDLVDVAGFAEQLGSIGSAFAATTFTRAELDAAAGSAGAAQHLAARFAAKEAFVKAWSAALAGRAPVVMAVDWREVELRTDPWGRPVLALHGEVAAAVAASLGPVRCHVSLTHEPTTAAAVVVIEPEDPR
ncbi:MAG: holo-ACP synthase [Candidatus Nanopelagicales bacterium]|jgi:holo-[acyl-carrier protein] synthase|nr:holo-ACP synthase [Candidatus Nanopelagicales bacterium]